MKERMKAWNLAPKYFDEWCKRRFHAWPYTGQAKILGFKYANRDVNAPCSDNGEHRRDASVIVAFKTMVASVRETLTQSTVIETHDGIKAMG
jgi:hypothetical protein